MSPVASAAGSAAKLPYCANPSHNNRNGHDNDTRPPAPGQPPSFRTPPSHNNHNGHNKYSNDTTPPAPGQPPSCRTQPLQPQ
eukprot:g73806.t1